MRERLAALWDRLDCTATVINLKGRSDRELHAREAANAIALPIEFFYAEKHIKGGTAGCFDSHQKVCEKYLQRGDPMGLILEDDFMHTEELLTEAGAKALEEAIEFAHKDTNWKIIYFGVLPNIWFEKSVKVGQHMYKMKPWACTHAMLVSRAYMEEIVSWKFIEGGKDAYDWRHRKCTAAYAFHPQALKQFESPSDIRSVQLPTPGFLRDMPVNMASWYALNIGISLAHSIIVFTVIAVVMSLSGDPKRQNKILASTVLQRAIPP